MYRLLLAFILLTSNAFAQSKIINGIIHDASTASPIPFANVGLKEKPVGTITNMNGQFKLTLSSYNSNDTLSVSHIGYEPWKLPMDSITSDTILIELTPAAFELAEFVVYPIPPEEIIQKMIANVPQNYSTDNEYLDCFFREWFSANQNGRLTEAAFQFYSPAYTSDYKDPNNDDMALKMTKGRKYDYIVDEDLQQLVTIGVGPQGVAYNDPIHNFPAHINPKRFKWFDYHIKGIYKQGDESYYKIEFHPKDGSKKKIYAGEMIINTKTYALVRVDSYIPENTKKNFMPGFAIRALMNMMGIEITFDDIRSTIIYAEKNGKLRPSYSQTDGYVTVTRPKKNEQFDLVINTQFSYNTIKSSNATPFLDDEKYVSGGYEDVTGKYSDDYWKGYQVVEPTKELKAILEKIRLHTSSAANQHIEKITGPQN